MVSADKLIKVGVKYSDKYFETLKNIYNNAYRNNDSLEDFLNETKDYSIGNPLEAGGFKEQLTNLVVASTNDIRFSRPAQKALMNTIISNTTGELITNVGDDIKAGVRDIVSRGYSEGKLNHNRVADEINAKLDGINRKRARTIARTEIKRAQTTSNYVVARERGANAYTYKCGAKPCDICIEDCGETFPIDDMEHLPPRHPNCMCGVSFFKDPSLPDVESTSEDDENNTPTEPTSTAPKLKPKTNSYSINHDNSFSDVKITEKQFKNVIKHQKKRANAKFEFGNSIDNETGQLIHSKDIRGQKNRVHIPTSGREYSVIHNHTNNGGFSGGDAYSQLTGRNQEVCYATTPKGIWIMRDTSQARYQKENMGISDATAYDVQNKMDSKFREFANESKAKYEDQYNNAESTSKKREILDKVNSEAFDNYNNYILEEFAVGKRRDYLIEIEFIPIEMINDVKF